MSAPSGIVIHITSGDSDDWEMALRNILNLAREESVAVPPELMQVVVNGEAVKFLLSSATASAEITQMTEAGVEIGACSNSLDRFGYDPSELTGGVQTVQSGVAEVVRAQKKGYTYLKLP